MSESVQMTGLWLQAIFTIALLSVAFKDNPAYRFAENTYVGLFAGYQVVVQWFSYIRPNIETELVAKGMWSYVIPIAIGLLIYTRYIKPIAWLSRYNICFLLGIGSGYIISTSFKPLFVEQIRATFLPLWVSGNLLTTFSNWVYVVGTVTSLIYFLFTLEKKGIQGGVSAVGRWTMMLAFGAAFGNTVMARVSLFLGRIQFLLHDWLKII